MAYPGVFLVARKPPQPRYFLNQGFHRYWHRTTGGARWPSGLERWTGERTVWGSNPTAENFSLRNFAFGNSVYPALPVSFGEDTKSRQSLLSGVYARGSKIPHQSALECVTVVDSTAHSKLPQKCAYAAENATLH